MGSPQGIVRVQQFEKTIQVQVEGWGTMNQSLPLRRYTEQGLAKGVNRLRIDLAPCSYFDSTFLGTLFLLKRALQRCPQGEFALVAPSPPCLQLLRQMGVADVFPMAAALENRAVDWKVLENSGEVRDFQCNVFQAHQELAGLGGTIGETFRPVVQCLSGEMEKEQLSGTK